MLLQKQKFKDKILTLAPHFFLMHKFYTVVLLVFSTLQWCCYHRLKKVGWLQSTAKVMPNYAGYGHCHLATIMSTGDSGQERFVGSTILCRSDSSGVRFCAGAIRREHDSAQERFVGSTILRRSDLSGARFCAGAIRRVHDSAQERFVGCTILRRSDLSGARFCAGAICRVHDSAQERFVGCTILRRSDSSGAWICAVVIMRLSRDIKILPKLLEIRSRPHN